MTTARGHDRGSAWQSVHLVLPAESEGELYGRALDRVLLDLALPRIEQPSGEAGQVEAGQVEAGRAEGVDRPFFFVRYHDGRPHLRLRWQSLATVDPAAQDGERRRLEEACRRDPGVEAVQWVPYRPEVERYGGPAGLAWSEELFHRTSRTAVELLGRVREAIPAGSAENRSVRLGKALLAQLVVLHAFEPDRRRATELVGQFGDAYLHQRTGDGAERRRLTEQYRRGFDRQSDRLGAYVEAAWTALDDGDPLTPELDPLRDHLVRIRQGLRAASERGELRDGRGSSRWRDCVRWLLPSYLHMTNNRFGVDLREECYLAVVVHAILARPERADDPEGVSDPGRGQRISSP